MAHALVAELDPAPGGLVVEIGPGQGALTFPLLEKTAALSPSVRVLLIEKDDALAAALRERLGSHPATAGRCVVWHGDALEFDPANLWGEAGSVFVLGNLPYNQATAIVQRFASAISPARRILVTVQKEVALRMCAPHGCHDYAALSVLLQRWWRCRIVRSLPPEVFHPRPRVDSAAVLLERRPWSEIGRCDSRRLEELLRLGFGQRRKQLRKLINCPPALWSELAAAYGFPESARAEDLSVTAWQALAAAHAPDVPDHSPPGQDDVFDVVDENDCVVESLPRRVVHARGLLHRSVHILLLNTAGQIFLQRRVPWKEINPAVWDSSAAGHLDAGETYISAAYRELREELGVSAELTPIGKLKPCEATGQEFIEVYAGRHEGPFRLAGLEVMAGAFFPLDRVRRWAASFPHEFSPVFLLCLPLLEEHLLSSKG